MKTYKYPAWFVLFVLLAACAVPAGGGVTPPAPTATSTPTFTPVPLTATALPTGTPAPAPTALPTQAPLPTELPKFPLDGYVMLFTKDGDLYFQDGENAPIRLTHGGELPSAPILSDDSQKVVFLRGKSTNNDSLYSNLYSVNSDGREEKILVVVKSK